MHKFSEGDIVAGAAAGHFKVIGTFTFGNGEEGYRLVEVNPRRFEPSRWSEAHPLVLPKSCLALVKPVEAKD